jgi:hypothetical protein
MFSACRNSVIYVSLLAHKSLLHVCNVTFYYCFMLVDFKVVVLLSFLNFYFNGLEGQLVGNVDRVCEFLFLVIWWCAYEPCLGLSLLGGLLALLAGLSLQGVEDTWFILKHGMPINRFFTFYSFYLSKHWQWFST